MQKYLSEKEIKEIIINEFRSRGEYADTVRFANPHGAHGCYVNIIPNPMCTHNLYTGESAIREIDGKKICPICGLEFTKTKF